MGRAPLPLGGHGSIRIYGLVDDRWQPAESIKAAKWKASKWKAITTYRGRDGRTGPLERSGTTKVKAEAALREEILRRAGTHSATLTRKSQFSVFASAWLRQAEERDEAGLLAGNTLDNYRSVLHKHILPQLAEVRIFECTVGHMEDFFENLKKSGTLSPGSIRIVRTVVAQILDIAVRRTGVFDHNPVRSVSRIIGGSRKLPRALTVAEVAEFLALVDADKGAVRSDLPDLLRIMLGTGFRIGEALGLRWRDVTLTDSAATSIIQVTGNVIYESRRGVVRHEGKTFAARRNVGVPEFLYTLLLFRKPIGAEPDDPLFQNSKGGWKNPDVVHNSIARLRRRISPETDPERWEWLTSHVMRKTVATLLDVDGHTARAIADQLGHADPSMTQRVYMGRGVPNPAAPQALDRVHRQLG